MAGRHGIEPWTYGLLEVNESVAAERDAIRLGYVSRDEVRRQTRAVIDAAHARKRRHWKTKFRGKLSMIYGNFNKS